MASRSARSKKDVRNPEARLNIFAFAINVTIGSFLRFFVWAVLAVVVSICIEWGGIAAGFWGASHSSAVLESELGYLSTFNRNLLTGYYPADLAHFFIRHTHSALAWLRLDVLSESLVSSASTVARAIGIGLQSAINIFFIFCARLAISITSIPGFVLVVMLGFMDGLTEREIRKSCGGIESAMVYHYSKRLVIPFVAFAFALYLTLPVSIHPLIIFVPAMFITAYVVFVASSTFKKFL